MKFGPTRTIQETGDDDDDDDDGDHDHEVDGDDDVCYVDR